MCPWCQQMFLALGFHDSTGAQVSHQLLAPGYQELFVAFSLHNRIEGEAPHALQVQARPPMAVTNAVSWRSEGIRYKKNEVFLDVVESVNLLVNSNGSVVRSEVMGALKMRTFLSGMPECKLGLNDKVRPSSDDLNQSQATSGCGSLSDCW